jgi:hypothetical protein
MGGRPPHWRWPATTGEPRGGFGHPRPAGLGWPKPPHGPRGVVLPPPRAKKKFEFFLCLALGPHGHRGWFVHPQPVPKGGRSHPKLARPPQTGRSGVAEATPWLTYGGQPPPMGWPATHCFLSFILVFYNFFLFAF